MSPTPPPCTRTLDTSTGSLRCSRHPGPALPWSPQRGCALPVASVCAVCARTQVPIDHRFSWSFVCPACVRLDAALGRAHGAAMMTPTRGQHDTEAATVWAAVFPDRASRTTVSLEPGPVLSVRAITSPGNDAWLTRLGRHRTGTVRALAAGAGLTGVVPWPVWAATFPASVHASAAGYRQYIAVVHPWVDTVEPRTADLGWLTALAADPP